MRKNTLILFLGLALSSFTVTAMEIEGVEIPDTLSLPNSDTTLVLNGAGIREKFFMDIFRYPDSCIVYGNVNEVSMDFSTDGYLSTGFCKLYGVGDEVS